MKKLVAITFLLLSITSIRANNPYRNYLLSRINQPHLTAQIMEQSYMPSVATIPKYQIPKGAIFCRMEDKVTRLTKVWLKVGVE